MSNEHTSQAVNDRLAQSEGFRDSQDYYQGRGVHSASGLLVSLLGKTDRSKGTR